MRSVHKVSVEIIEVITVFDSMGTEVTGLVNADFSKIVTKDGAVTAVSATVTEINAGTRPGEYKVSFTPDAVGQWRLRVEQSSGAGYNKKGWQATYDVRTDGVLSLSEIAVANRTEMDANSADLNTIIAALASINADTDDIQARLPAALVGGKIDATLSSAERDSIATALLNLANGIETGYTVKQALRVMAAAIAGKSSGDPGSPVFRNLGDSADRIAATVDGNGNRTTVTLTP